jgi:hypothetical protein
MRSAVPEANPALSLTAALAITFPFNILIGIPLYQRIACDPSDPYWFEGCERLASKLSSSGIPFDGQFDHVSRDRADYDRGELKKAIRDLPEKVREASRQLEVV